MITINITYRAVKELIENKIINKTDDTPYEELSEYLFGEGNCFNESEVRKRMYGMKRLIEIIESEKSDGIATKILSLSDLHIPFQLDFTTLKDYRNVDILQINGDIVDCQALSKFSKQYRISPMEEIIQGRQYLIDLIEYIKPKKVICNYGNHDKRFSAYFAKNLDSDILELMPDTSLELIFVDGFRHYDKRSKTKIWYEPLCNVFDDIEIEYTNNWYCQIGDTIFCHPTAYSSGILKTAEKAMLWFRNEGFNFRKLVMAHTHRIGQYTIGNTTIYEQGAFCNTRKNNYSDGKLFNSQKEGFIFIAQDAEGNTIDNKTELIVLK